MTCAVTISWETPWRDLLLFFVGVRLVSPFYGSQITLMITVMIVVRRCPPRVTVLRQSSHPNDHCYDHCCHGRSGATCWSPGNAESAHASISCRFSRRGWRQCWRGGTSYRKENQSANCETFVRTPVMTRRYQDRKYIPVMIESCDSLVSARYFFKYEQIQDSRMVDWFL